MSNFSSKIVAISFISVITAIVTACGSDGDESSTAALITPVEAVVESESDSTQLECAAGLSAVDLPLGSRQDLDGTSFELSETYADNPKWPGSQPQVQRSVTLNAVLSSSIALPAVVVSTSNGSTTGDPKDGQLSLGLPTGSTGSYTIVSDAYVPAQYLYGGVITGLTLCLDYSSPQPGS